jgi:hypothetical protein
MNSVTPTTKRDNFPCFCSAILMHHVCITAHAFGFSSIFYNSYLDSARNYHATPLLEEFVTGVSPAGNPYNKTLLKLATPNVVAFARQEISPFVME